MRRAILTFVLIAAAAPSAFAQNPYAQRQKALRFTGDALLRYEWTRKIPSAGSTIDESRYRLQARPRIEATVGPLELGVGGEFNYSKDENDKAPAGETLTDNGALPSAAPHPPPITNSDRSAQRVLETLPGGRSPGSRSQARAPSPTDLPGPRLRWKASIEMAGLRSAENGSRGSGPRHRSRWAERLPPTHRYREGPSSFAAGHRPSASVTGRRRRRQAPGNLIARSRHLTS